jgi:hypothetical protein
MVKVERVGVAGSPSLTIIFLKSAFLRASVKSADPVHVLNILHVRMANPELCPLGSA